MQFVFIFLLILASSLGSSVDFFPEGRHSVYRYRSHIRTGITKPTGHGNFWELDGHLHIYGGSEGMVIFKLVDPQVGVYDGEITSKNIQLPGPMVPVSDDMVQILAKPWAARYRDGLVTELDLGEEGDKNIEMDNIKRAIVSLLQLDMSGYNNHSPVWTSKEENIYGTCQALYTSIETKNHDEVRIKKFVDHSNCKNQPKKIYSFSPVAKCIQHKTESSSSSQRLFVLTHNKEKPSEFQLNRLESNASNLFLPFRHYGNAKYVYTTQRLKLETTGNLAASEANFVSGLKTSLQFKHFHIKPESVEGVIKLLEKIVHTSSLNMEKVETIETAAPQDTLLLRAWLQSFSKDELIDLMKKVEEKKTISNFLNYLIPSIGTKAALEMVVHLYKIGAVKSMDVSNMLPQTVSHLVEPNEEFLSLFEVFLEFDATPEAKKAIVLSSSSLIGRVCEKNCRPDILTKWTTHCLKKLETATEYEDKILYMHALGNMRPSNLIELLSPIIKSNPNRYLRFQGLLAIQPFVLSHPKEIYTLLWPIFVNRAEPIELRIIAFSNLLLSEPTPGRLIHMHWFIDSQKDPQLYHYYSSVLESFKSRHHPCILNLKHAIQHVESFVKNPPSSHWATTFYANDVVDDELGIGSSNRFLSIATSNKIWPTMFFWKFEEWARGHVMHDTQIYFRGEGIFDSMFYLNPTSTPEKVMASLQELININLMTQHDSHFEMVIMKNNRVSHIVAVTSEKLPTLLRGIYNSLFLRKEAHLEQDLANWVTSITTSTVTDLGTLVRERFDSHYLCSINYNTQGTVHEKDVGIHNAYFRLKHTTNVNDIVVTFNPILHSKHAVLNTAQTLIDYPLNTTCKFYSDKEKQEHVGDLTFHNNLGRRVTFGWERNVTSIVSSEASKVMAVSCPECHLTSLVPVPDHVDMDDLDEDTKDSFLDEHFGVVFKLEGQIVNIFDSELFEQIFESIFTNSRIIGYVGSPWNLLSYISAHEMIVNLAKNEKFALHVDFVKESDIKIKVQIPHHQSKLEDHFILLLEHTLKDEEPSTHSVKIEASSKSEEMQMIVDLDTEYFKRCIKLDWHSPLFGSEVFKLNFKANCSVEENMLQLKISDSWSVKESEDSIWPLEMCETLPEVEDWYNEYNEYDKACKEFWKDQSYNISVGVHPLLPEDIVVEFKDHDVEIHSMSNKNTLVKSSAKSLSKSLYELAYDHHDFYGFSVDCIANMHHIITWDRFQRNWQIPSSKCYSLLAADNNVHPEYAIWVKQIDETKKTIGLKVYAAGTLLEIQPKEHGQFEIFNITLADQHDSIPQEGIHHSIELKHREGHLIIYTDDMDIMTNGHYVYMSGDVIIWRQVTGLCGSFDGDPFNDIGTNTFQECQA